MDSTVDGTDPAAASRPGEETTGSTIARNAGDSPQDEGHGAVSEEGKGSGGDNDDDDDEDDDDEGEGFKYDSIDMSGMKVISITAENGEEDYLEPSKQLDDWVIYALAQSKEGIDFNDLVRKNHDFRNPAILEKMVAFCELEEHGTNMPIESHFSCVTDKALEMGLA